MLIPFKDQGPPRSRRSHNYDFVYNGHRAARSSRLSMFSALTVQSNGSNGSNSTVTQESYNKASRKKRSSRRKRDSTRAHHAAIDPVPETLMETESQDPKDEGTDVFAYLVGEGDVQHNDDDNDNDDDERPPSPPAPPEEEDEHGHQHEHEPEVEPEPVPYPEDASRDPGFSTQSFYSDSGISMDDRSSLSDITGLQIPSRLSEDIATDDPTISDVPPREHLQWRYPVVPKARYHPIIPEEDGPDDHNDADMHDVRHGSPSPPSALTDDDPIWPPSTDHLAAKLAEIDSPALFKSFKKTNYRLLLQLQHELMELQDELAYLDSFDGSRRPSHAGAAEEHPSRQSWQWRPCSSDLSRAKNEVLGRLQFRMDQYYKTLLLARKVHGLRLPEASKTWQVSKFQAILAEHFNLPLSGNGDVSAEETAPRFGFLEDANDLLSLDTSSQSSSQALPGLQPISLLPLIVSLILFKVCFGVINRLLVVGVTLAASFWLTSYQGTAPRHTQYGLVWSACIAACIGIFF